MGIKEDNIIIGIHSGKHAIINKLQSMNIDFDIDKIDEYVLRIKEYLELHKTITDDKLKEIVCSNKIKIKHL